MGRYQTIAIIEIDNPDNALGPIPMDFDSFDEDLVRLLGNSQKRTILTILIDTTGPISVEELAKRLVEHDTYVLRSAAYESQREQTAISLHHDHLPALADAGVVEYDSEEKIVTLRDQSGVDADWLDIEQIDEVLACLRGSNGSDATDIGVIEGRETLIKYGVELANQAEEELFCLYVTDDLLDESCISSERRAVERGVSMAVGSPDPTVREHCREHLPEATVWEPQYDWMTPSSNYPKVGRLVFADRTKLMLGFVDEPRGKDAPPETAMIGEGENNPLVVLVRELLGRRLDHLDFQSKEFRSNLP